MVQWLTVYEKFFGGPGAIFQKSPLAAGGKKGRDFLHVPCPLFKKSSYRTPRCFMEK
jgi:hypothetical protein